MLAFAAFFWFATALIPGSLTENLPEPRVVILAQPGAGKSTLVNVLLGENPDCQNCTFNICQGHDSCTMNTKYAVGSWLGDGAAFTAVDTPAFGDSYDDETHLIDEMINVLHTFVNGANALVLLIDGYRMNALFQQMIREMQAHFGESFWLHTIIGVSHWAYDADSVAERNRTNMTEDNYVASCNEFLRSKFHIEKDLEGVFIDAWSQQPWNLFDENQQVAFARETGKLWSFLENKDVFPFRTIDDMKDEIKWLNDVITNNITELTNQMADLSKAHIEDIEVLAEDIDSVRDEMNGLASSPVGTIQAWTPIPNLDSSDAVTLPDGWVECDGQLITEGIWKGQHTPNINETVAFSEVDILRQLWSLRKTRLKPCTIQTIGWGTHTVQMAGPTLEVLVGKWP